MVDGGPGERCFDECTELLDQIGFWTGGGRSLGGNVVLVRTTLQQKIYKNAADSTGTSGMLPAVLGFF